MVIVNNRYFNDLVDFVDGIEYRGVLWRLFITVFHWDIAMDKNRASDGLKLRDKFNARDVDIDRVFKNRDDVSVLEVLIAMSIRCEEDIMRMNGAGDRTIEWFWLMLDNLELYSIGLENDLHDEVYQASTEDYIENVLTRFMNRNYNFDGSNGGLFIVKHPRRDMREVDLWMQLNWWLVEKYGYEI